MTHPERDPAANPAAPSAEQAGLRQAKQPLTVLAGTYGHPIHPALVTVPIGAWVASFAFDLGSRVVSQPAFLSQGSRWLIAIGVLGALVAAIAGSLDLFAIPTGTPAFRIGTGAHVAQPDGDRRVRRQSARTVEATSTLGRSAGVRSCCRRSVSPLVAAAGFLGGKLAYHYGVRVADERTQAEGFRTTKKANDSKESH